MRQCRVLLAILVNWQKHLHERCNFCPSPSRASIERVVRLNPATATEMQSQPANSLMPDTSSVALESHIEILDQTYCLKRLAQKTNRPGFDSSGLDCRVR